MPRATGHKHLWWQLAALLIALWAAARVDAESFECLIEPTQVVEIRCPVEGLIDKVYVERGDTVTKGDALVQLQSDVERSSVEAAHFRAEMQGRLAAAKNRLEFAQKKLDRWDDLLKHKFVAAQERDEAETEQRLAEAELQQATEEKELARLDYRHALDVLDLRTLHSPLDGVVVDRMLNPGDLAESGTDRKPILKLAQIDPLRVEVVLPEAAFGKVKLGMRGTVIPEGLGGRYEGQVTVVDRVLDAASGTLGVRLELPNPEGKLPGGLRCQVEFPQLKGIAPRLGGRPKEDPPVKVGY
jgi:RND family efflux transporter MFP subunit